MLARTNRVVRGDEYRTVVRRGAKTVGRHTITYTWTNPASQQVRFGFIAAKSVGSAVARNLVRRRLKAVCYDLIPAVPAGTDVVIRALANSQKATWSTLKAEVDRAVLMGTERS